MIVAGSLRRVRPVGDVFFSVPSGRCTELPRVAFRAVISEYRRAPLTCAANRASTRADSACVV